MAKKVFIVEDEGILALNVQKLLNRMGYDACGIATSGEEAVEKAEALRPDIVLMDIHLHGKMDGIEAAQKIQKSLDIPIVYTTAYSDEETTERAKITEPSAYLLKPYDAKDLQVAIEVGFYKHQMEKKRREREKWVSTVLRSIGDAVLSIDREGKVTYMNSRAEAMVGWRSEEALGQPIHALFSLSYEKDQKAIPFSFRDPISQTIPYDPENPPILTDRNGNRIPVECQLTPLEDENGAWVGEVYVVRDMSLRQKMEEEKKAVEFQLIQAQKLEAIGRFSRGLVHDINNFLAVIEGHAELQMRENYNAGVEAEHLEAILYVLEKAHQFTESLLLFCRNKELQIQDLEINRILKGLESILRSILNGGIQLVYELAESPIFIEADQIQFEQAIINLVLNARDAMPKGGMISISSRTVELQKSALKGHPEVSPGWFCHIAVSDSGPGMTPEAKEKLFQPFVTTKQGGNGLGLAVVYGIVKSFHGFVEVETKPGRGTTFHLYFPLAMNENPVGWEIPDSSSQSEKEDNALPFWQN